MIGKRGSAAGMLAPEEDAEAWGELESTKLGDEDEDPGTDGADISRRECLDRLLIVNQRHLDRVLQR